LAKGPAAEEASIPATLSWEDGSGTTVAPVAAVKAWLAEKAPEWAWKSAEDVGSGLAAWRVLPISTISEFAKVAVSVWLNSATTKFDAVGAWTFVPD
jgi:hypothetical protein